MKRSNKSKITLFAFLGVTAALFFGNGGAVAFASELHGTIPVKGKSKKDDSTLAKISLQDAIASAQKEVNGKVVEATLDREDGYLVYEIDIALADQSHKEMLIDAGDGRVLKVKTDD